MTDIDTPTAPSADLPAHAAADTPVAGAAQPDAAAAEPKIGNRRPRGGRRGRGGAGGKPSADGSAPADASPNPAAAASRPQAQRQPRSYPVLEKLAALYPQLFGAVFLPLKRGIFQELLAAHPDAFEREALKDALAQHTRSTRYLTAVAAGQQRHDLQGQPVEAMAPEHVHHALLEVFRRRQGRGGGAGGEDLRAKLRERMVAAFEASGLARDAYAELVHSRDEAANAVLAEALEQSAARSAKDEALRRAFESSGQTVEGFADMYGMAARDVAAMLKRVKRAEGTAPQGTPA